MVPTGQTVVAALLALGLARGPSDAQPATPPDPVEAPAAPATSEAEPEAEPEPSDAEPAAPETNSDVASPDTSAEAVPELEHRAPALEPPATDAPPELEPTEAREDESWDEEDESWDEEDEAWDDDYDPLRDSPEALTAQRRIAGGAVVLGLGAVVSVGGLVMALSDPCARPAGNSCAAASRNRAALTMALPGLATVAVGSVMLALGIRQRKALRVDAKLNASGAGVSLRGRF